MRNAIFAFLFAVAASAAEPTIGPYIYSMGGDMRMIHSSGDWRQIEPLLERWSGTYFWVRHGGREYLIRDEATLAKIGQTFAPMHAASAELEKLHGRMRPVEQRERDVERRVDAIEDREDDDGRVSEADRRRLAELREELRGIQSELRVFEAEEERLDEKQEAIEKDAERRIVPVIEEAIRNGAAKPL